MTGREILLTSMRKKAKSFVLEGIAVMILGGLFLTFVIINEWNVFFIVCIGVLALLGVYLLLNGVLLLINPYKDSVFKKNPRLLSMADELYADIQYQDKLVVLSRRIFAPNNAVWWLAPLDEVYWVFVEKTSTNGIPTDKKLWFVTGAHRFPVNIHGMNSTDIDRTINVLLQACPNLRAGHTPENSVYADEMQKQWRLRYPEC